MKITLTLAALLLATPAVAQEPEDEWPGMRAEAWLGLSSWPALSDIEPVLTGEFDGIGLALGGAIHWPVAQVGSGKMLAGFDGFIGATGSTISGFIGDANARHMYLGGSVKWALGESRSVFLDAGYGFHLVDIAQLSEYIYGPEQEAWQSSAGGGYLGVTWDAGAGSEGTNSGWSLGLKVHFVDLGVVRDEDPFAQPILGQNAGELDGPVYMLQVGYSSR